MPNKRTRMKGMTRMKSHRTKRVIKKLKKGPPITGAPPERDITKEWHKPVKPTKRGVKKAEKKYEGIFVEKPISLRHRKFLEKPDKPFAQGYTSKERIAEGMGLGSTAVVSYTYYPEPRMLILHWWKNWKKKIPGSKYAYFDVPNWRFEKLLRASSKGRYIYYNIRSTYKYKRLS